MKRVFVLIFSALLSSATSAATMNPDLYKDDICDRYELVHINGIMTTLFDAQANVLGLGEAFGNSHNGHQVFYGLAYNQTESLAADLRQSIAQLAASYPGSTYTQWLSFVMNGIWPNSVPAQFFAQVTGTIATFVADVRRPTTTQNDPDIPLMMNAIGQHHRSGRIVFLGHSQGTIYANILYNILTGPGYRSPNQPAYIPTFQIPSTRLGVVSVAAVVSSVPGGSYVTSSNDAVVDAVRRIVPATLRHTHTLQYIPSVDDLGHNLRTTYLAQTTGRNAIVASIGAKFDMLRPKPNTGTFSSPYMISGYAAWNNCRPGTSMYACTNGKTTGEEVYYALVGTAGIQIRDGSFGEITGLATSQAATCVSRLVSGKIARVNAGGPKHGAPVIANCSSATAPLEQWAWQIYSADGMSISALWPPSPAGGYSETRVYAKPVCN